MRVQQFISSLVLIGTFTLAPACGNDPGTPGADGGSGDGGRGPGTDGSPRPDATILELLRSGKVTVLDLAGVTNVPDPIIVQGASTLVNIDNRSTGYVQATYPYDDIFNCMVFEYNLSEGQQRPVQMDEGEISITGTLYGEFGCRFFEDAGRYRCQSNDPAVASGSATSATMNNVTGRVTFSGVTFPAEVRGMGIRFQGFPDAAANDRLYPITAVEDDGATLALMNLPVTSVDTDGITFDTFIGEAPITGALDFVGENEEIVVSKEAGPVVDAFEGSMRAPGQGFQLVNDPENGYYLPHAIPTDGSAWSFRCEGAGCGAPGASTPNEDVSGPNTAIPLLIATGFTTDAPLPTAAEDPLAVAFPPPINRTVEFTCVTPIGPLDENLEVTVPAEVMELVLDGATRLTVVAGVARSLPRSNDLFHIVETWAMSIITGHGIVGLATVQ